MTVLNEKNSDQVFGNTLKRYSKNEMLEFINPFKIRFKKNKIKLLKYVKNKSCVDIGCGNGRGTIFLFMNKAKRVDCVDISKINLKKTFEVSKIFKKQKFIEKIHSNSENIPIDSLSKDFVWCNGVLMHTHNPLKSLMQINRILKNNHYAYIYVYGVGGLYWSLVEIFRDELKNISPKKLIDVLLNLGYSNRYVAEYLDDWKVLHLRKYSKKNFEKAIIKCGFKIVKYMNRGLNYDTSEKKYKTRNRIYGDGDLRYLIKKIKHKSSISENLLLKNSCKYKESKKIEKFILMVKKNFSMIKNYKKKVAYAAIIQNKLRNEMSKKSNFQEKQFFNFIKKQYSNIN